MSFEANKTLVGRFVEEFWNQGNMSAADELMTANAIIMLPGQGQVNKATLKAFASSIHSAFPDWHTTVEALGAEDEQVVEQFTGRGTHRGNFQGIAPTGKQVAVPGFVFFRVASGKIAEFRGVLDGFTMLNQLGAMAATGQAESR